MDEFNQSRKDSSIIKVKHIYLLASFGRFFVYGLEKIRCESKYPIACARESFNKLVIGTAFLRFYLTQRSL